MLEALDECERLRPDIVVLSYHPEPDVGQAVARRAKALPCEVRFLDLLASDEACEALAREIGWRGGRLAYISDGEVRHFQMQVLDDLP